MGVDIRMTTNGSKLSKNLSKELIDAGLTHISVSLDVFLRTLIRNEIFKLMKR